VFNVVLFFSVGCKVDGYIYDAPTKLCLKFFESPKLNWTDAQRYCNSSKGQLAIITGDQKIKDVLAFYKSGGRKLLMAVLKYLTFFCLIKLCDRVH
jgi:hypothetical protein